MDWVDRAKELFEMPKPAHFTNFTHCEECEEHDKTLLEADIDTIGLKELGNPGWDPVYFASSEGKKYYVPAFIRISLNTMKTDFYMHQFLTHLEMDGPNNKFYLSCTKEQRNLVSSFIAYVVENYVYEVEANCCSDQILKCYEIWSKP